MQRLHRRQLLRGCGVSLALPWLECFAGQEPPGQPLPRRMVCICSPLGIRAQNFFPATAGDDFELTPYLEPLAELRPHFTIISGLSHPDVGPFHDSFNSFLTGAPHPENRAGFQNSISLDQLAAEQLRGRTRYASLTLGAEGAGLAWTRSGAPVPADASPARVFRRLFLDGSPEEVQAELKRLQSGRSILDTLRAQRTNVLRSVGPNDAHKLEEYFTSVRELEQQLADAELWTARPKPDVPVEPLQDVANQADILAQENVWYRLIRLALQTDSTRLITLALSGLTGVPAVDGVGLGYHDLSHHGQDPGKLEQLRRIELAKMQDLADFLQSLHAIPEADGTLLDRTMVFYSSNLGNASSHDVRNLPVLLAGGGFRHGQHLAFDQASPPPLSNLYLAMLQRLDPAVDRFASATGTLSGLDIAG